MLGACDGSVSSHPIPWACSNANNNNTCEEKKKKPPWFSQELKSQLKTMKNTLVPLSKKFPT